VQKSWIMKRLESKIAEERSEWAAKNEPIAAAAMSGLLR